VDWFCRNIHRGHLRAVFNRKVGCCKFEAMKTVLKALCA